MRGWAVVASAIEKKYQEQSEFSHSKTIINEEGKEEKLSFNAILGLLKTKNQKTLDSLGKAIDEITAEYAEVAENEITSNFV